MTASGGGQLERIVRDPGDPGTGEDRLLGRELVREPSVEPAAQLGVFALDVLTHDDEVHRVVDFLKTQAKPVYDMDILKPRPEDSDGEGAPDDFHDEFYDQAVAIVCETRQASVSYIQRRLQIGYNRAARLVEQMEREGIVGAANGANPVAIVIPCHRVIGAGGDLVGYGGGLDRKRWLLAHEGVRLPIERPSQRPLPFDPA